MPSGSSGMGVGDRAMKFCANIINVVILIFALEDVRITSILKMFSFISSEIFKFLTTSISSFFRFYEIFNL
jgi:non-ribosomal peptide synthetase component E (peptide arylation enzyme)